MKKITPTLALLLSACGGGGEQGAPAGHPEVGVVTVRAEAVVLSSELPGRTSAYETSDVRPQVNGLILQRLFTEGDQVQAGPAPYRIPTSPSHAQGTTATTALRRPAPAT